MRRTVLKSHAIPLAGGLALGLALAAPVLAMDPAPATPLQARTKPTRASTYGDSPAKLNGLEAARSYLLGLAKVPEDVQGAFAEAEAAARIVRSATKYFDRIGYRALVPAAAAAASPRAAAPEVTPSEAETQRQRALLDQADLRLGRCIEFLEARLGVTFAVRPAAAAPESKEPM